MSAERAIQFLRSLERQHAYDTLKDGLEELVALRLGDSTEPFFSREEIEQMVQEELDRIEEERDD